MKSFIKNFAFLPALLVLIGIFMFTSCQKEEVLEVTPEPPMVQHNLKIGPVDGGGGGPIGPVEPTCFQALAGIDWGCDGTLNAYTITTIAGSFELCKDIVQAELDRLNEIYWPHSCGMVAENSCREIPCLF